MDKLTDTTRAIMEERFGKDSLMALATAVDNVPFVRTVDACYRDSSFYVITHALSGKMQQIQDNPRVSLCGEWFTAAGIGGEPWLCGQKGKCRSVCMAPGNVCRMDR